MVGLRKVQNLAGGGGGYSLFNCWGEGLKRSTNFIGGSIRRWNGGGGGTSMYNLGGALHENRPLRTLKIWKESH